MARREPSYELPFFADGGGGPVEVRTPGVALPFATARLRRVALRITRDAAAAEDVVQSAFEKALRHAADYRGEAQASTWLHRIVVNEALAWRRSEGRRARYTEAAGEVTTSAAAALPLDALLQREQREQMLRALTRLRDDDRELLARYALDGTYAGWARAVQMKPTAAKTRAFRARRALRAALAERDD
jgi:RNA polymerase sigma-70 factor (ECF subfamily)